MKRFLPVIAVAAALVGCSEDGRTALGAQLLVPDAVDVQWDERMNARRDGLGILVPVDLMVYEGSSGEPLEMVRLDIDVDHESVVLEIDDVETLTGDCVDCVWDSGRDRYVVLPDADGSSKTLLTDVDGLARIYVWIDAFPTDGDSMLPVQVDVDSDETGSTFAIHGT